jgi:hypothetical protein
MPLASANEFLSKRRVDELWKIQPSKYELWKYYEDRADRLGERLWTTGVWLMTAIVATLTLPFAAKVVSAPGVNFPVQVVAPFPTAALAVFGIILCIYAFFALNDLREHIESNWRKAGYILEGTWESSWGGRKNHGWRLLLTFGLLAFSGFTSLLALATL